MVDGRDQKTWVVFELTSAGERVAAEGKLEAHLSGLFPEGAEFFSPYLSFEHGGKLSLFNVMEGYCFVISGYDETAYLRAASQSPFLKQVLHSQNGGLPVLHTIPDHKVCQLRSQLEKMIAVGIEEDMVVEIRKGICKGLVGRVLTLTEDSAQVLLTMRTLRTIRTIPRWALMPKGGQDE